jgi:hypothetical protein
MCPFLVRCAVFLGIAMSIFPTSATLAEERLVMPYACQASGGRVDLIPGPSQSYRIFGAPEHQVFTACSPIRPDLCRNWMVHRFALDCGGVRVSWLSVVDALTKWGPNRAWVSDGRLHVRMVPWWNGGPAGPCYTRRPFGYGPWAYGRPASGWPCARTLLNNQQPVVDMPAGFAPVLGIYARFISVPQTIASTTVHSGAVALGAGEGRNSLADQVVPRVSGPAVVPPAEAPPGVKLRTTSGNASSKALSKIGQSEGSPKTTASIPEEEGFHAGQGHGLAKVREGTNEITHQAPIAPIGMNNFSAGKVGFGLVAILLVSAILLAWTRRAEPVDAAALASRFTAAEPRSTPNPFRPRSSAPWRGSTEDDEWLPSNRSEALQVLGASPETAEDVLKKIVKTLRQKWHPDLANREEERRVRGLRLKQINVAWDIICGKRASA